MTARLVGDGSGRRERRLHCPGGLAAFCQRGEANADAATYERNLETPHDRD
jgi:hypothetical protein